MKDWIAKLDTAEIGQSGLRGAYSGYLNEEFLPALRGRNASKVYRQMADNDPVIGAFLFAMEMLIRQMEWCVKPADDSEQAAEVADFVEDALFHDMEHTWADFISEACTMLVFGYAPFEIVWKLRKGPSADPARRSRYTDGRVAPRKIALRAQETVDKWELSETGDILGVWQQPEVGQRVMVPVERLLLLRTRSVKNNPEGRSILRTAYRPWHMKTRMEEIEGIGVERDLAGLPVCRVPGDLLASDASVGEKATLRDYQEMVTQIKRNNREGIVLPSNRDDKGNLLFDITLLSTGGSRSFNTSEIIDRYDRRIATAVLADFIFLGQAAVGSFALSSDKTALFATALGALVAQIAQPLNRVLLPQIMALNGINQDLTPEMQPGDIERPDLTQLGDFIQKLSGAGAPLFPDRALEDHLRRSAGLPEAPEDGPDADAREAAMEQLMSGRVVNQDQNNMDGEQ